MPSSPFVVDPNLTRPDNLVLRSLIRDVERGSPKLRTGGSLAASNFTSRLAGEGSEAESDASGRARPNGKENSRKRLGRDAPAETGDEAAAQLPDDNTILAHLAAINNPKDPAFEPTVIVSKDLPLTANPIIDTWLLQPYIAWARRVVRVQTDVVMLTHLLLYFSTSVPSAILLFLHFSYPHAVIHFVMQMYYVGTYTLMMHQHIHMRGILAPQYRLFDTIFPYITDPLMGHTWNSYFYHHVKHHHVEGNGPADLSSTLRYQRDSARDFLRYFGRFLLFVWLELPRYFLRKGKPGLAVRTFCWEVSSYIMIALAAGVNLRAAVAVLMLPLFFMRIGLMVGNWGQHALVDEEEPDSDYRSSITLIDVASNRFCYNDGYHTSHHLNPLRHWRDHPSAFLKGKATYAEQHALVFHDIDYIMLTVRLLTKNYTALARCLVPIGEAQIRLSLEERAEMLRRKTRRFSEEEIKARFAKA
ncbi:hypothetical protein EJ06DRAFT_543922 [Trichodelitschia bisporula]|uniref:Fatty acid desaturase domain-containing protein n=1 Tax=Trichodelitschia bisporula TaxID=703511 RepID=A0A6G1HRP0_9PEZI|nr:hypothetical protein EJ06DRAFT_543922 [Trichodelitschia bisporula]